jgi:hypothetical protein
MRLPLLLLLLCAGCPASPPSSSLSDITAECIALAEDLLRQRNACLDREQKCICPWGLE